MGLTISGDRWSLKRKRWLFPSSHPAAPRYKQAVRVIGRDMKHLPACFSTGLACARTGDAVSTPFAIRLPRRGHAAKQARAPARQTEARGRRTMPRSRNESPGGWRRRALNRSSGHVLRCGRRYARRICRDPRRDHAAEPYGGGKPDGARAADVGSLPVRRGRAGRAFRAAAAGGGANPVSRRHDRALAGASPHFSPAKQFAGGDACGAAERWSGPSIVMPFASCPEPSI